MVTSFITIFGRCASINRFASLLPLFKNYTADTSVKEVDSSDLIATTLSLSSQPTSLTSPTLSNSSSLSGTAYNLFRVFALTTPMNPWVTRKSIVPITFHHSHVVPPSTHFIWDIYRLGLFRKWYQGAGYYSGEKRPDLIWPRYRGAGEKWPRHNQSDETWKRPTYLHEKEEREREKEKVGLTS